MAISEQLYTWQEFEAFVTKHPDSLLELIDGRIVEKVTSELHGKIVGLILHAIISYLKNHPDVKGHWSTEAEFRPVDAEDNSRRPDVSFRLTDGTVSKSGIVQGMPDFCVEVKSWGNSYEELRDKARFYIANGAKLVWLMYPLKEIVEVYFADGNSELFVMADKLDGGDVLLGFEMPVADIFDI